MKHNRVLTAILVMALLGVAVAGIGWITKVRDWRIESSQLVDCTITTPDAGYMVLSTGGYTHKYIYASIGRTNTTTMTIDDPFTAYPATGIDSGVTKTIQTDGYVAIGDSSDTIVFSIQLPQDFIVTGTASDITLDLNVLKPRSSFTDTESLAVVIYSQSYGFDTPIVSDTIKIDSGSYSGYAGMTTLSTGFGAEGNFIADDILMVAVRGYASDGGDTLCVVGARIGYKVGHETTY